MALSYYDKRTAKVEIMGELKKEVGRFTDINKTKVIQ